MGAVWIFRHIACEGPGYLGRILADNNIPCRLIAVDQGETVPGSVEGSSGLVFMGGPMSVNDPLPWIEAELKLIRIARDKGLPVLGHCLGGQLIAKALGAAVRPNPVKEIGWHEVSSVAGHPYLQNIPDRFTAFHWHGETFDLPAGATRLLTSRWCPNQAFALEQMLAFQCHVEMTEEMVPEWAALYAGELASPSPSVQSRAAMMQDLPRRISLLQKTAAAFYANWLADVAGT
ncbi:MAG TPA: type 1 glutamine amidotransferase [Gammaproteobacteria bacterium]|nr:type 1 glutamine amidotransferase [Gammaproteobacteria bacterium]